MPAEAGDRATTAKGRLAPGSPRLARIALAVIVGLMAVFIAIGPSFGSVMILAQATGSPSPTPTGPGVPTIRLLNPSQDYDPVFGSPARPPGAVDPVKISDKFDGVDNRYHIVAAVLNAPPNTIIEAYYDPFPYPDDPFCGGGTLECDFEGERTIGLLDPVPGRTDTWQLFWDIPDGQPASPAIFTVRMYSATGAGVEQVAEDSFEVDVDPGEETTELTWPAQNGPLGFYKGRGGQWRTVIDGSTSSANVQRVHLRYTTSRPGTAAVYKTCATFSSPANSTNTSKSFQVTCTLEAADTPSQVTAIAAVANEDDSSENQCAPVSPPGCVTAENEFTLESADVHRVLPYVQTSSQMNVLIIPAGTGAHPDPGRSLVDEDNCLSFLVRVRDHLDRPVQGANLDLHVVGPNDSIGFGNEATAGDAPSGRKNPDKGGHSTEEQWDCDFPGDRMVGVPQGDSNVPAGNDTKHIESTTGTGLNGGAGVSFGGFRFMLFSDRVGLSDITAWVDDEDLPVEKDNRALDDDLLEELEPRDTFQAQWYSTAPTIQFDPVGATAVAGECHRYVLRVRSGAAAVPRTNVDVHATGPDDQLDFCNPADATPRRAPDRPTDAATRHDPEDDGEASHPGPSPRAQHTEGETDDAGNFVFGVTSPIPGDTTLVAWMDKEPEMDNDVQDAGEATATVVHSWGATLADASIRFVNPSGYGSAGDQISVKNDADANYHLVARTDAAGLVPGVEFLISPSASGPFSSIGFGTRVGTTDTFEMFWNANTMNDGSYTLRVQIVGSNKLEDRPVVINNDDTAASPGPPPTQAEFAFETAEITRPLNGAFAPFTRNATTVAGVASAGSDSVAFLYTKTSAATTRNSPQWIPCGRQVLSSTATAPQAFSGTCTLNPSDQPSLVTGLAAVSVDCDRNIGCPEEIPETGESVGSEAFDSGDAHRVFGFEGNPLVLIEPAEAENKPGECERFRMSVADQTGQPIANQNVDLHLTGPNDTASFCDPADGSTRTNPGDGSHGVSSDDPKAGFHDDPAGADTKHTEGTTGANGGFVFGIKSPEVGDSQVTAWADQTENDLLDESENRDTATMHWVAGEEPPQDRCTKRGTSGDDVLRGTSGKDIICGMGGKDVITGLGANDRLQGGVGSDTLRGGNGKDFLRGRTGNDRMFGGGGPDTLQAGRGKDRVDGGKGIDDCVGGPGKDRVRRCE